jgi:sulfite reductase (NADPH) flavoprotein alpha-component
MKVEEAEIVILLGSQKGKTETFANLLKDTLLRTKQKVVLHNLNHYAAFPKMKQLIVLTSTYGKGVPPKNGKNFLNLLKQVKNPKKVGFSVVGFGSIKYPKFCQFAKDVNAALLKHPNFNQTTESVYIDRNCFSTFLNWCNNWSKKTTICLNLGEFQKTPKPKSYKFEVENSYEIVDNSLKTIYIELSTKKYKRIKEGDLLVINSKKHKDQHYPIRQLSNKNVLISFDTKKTESISKQLKKFKKNKKFKAQHICNTRFQLLGRNSIYQKQTNTSSIPLINVS